MMMMKGLWVFLVVQSSLCLSIDLEEIFQDVNEDLKWMEEKQVLDENHPGHLRMFLTDGASQILRWNEFVRSATQKVMEKTGQSQEDAQAKVLEYTRINSKNFGLVDVCSGTDTVTPCNSSEISSIFPPIGGRCNNINYPLTGTINRPFRRILTPCVRDIINTRNTLLALGREDVEEVEVSNKADSLPTSRSCGSNPSSIIFENFDVICTGNQLPNPRLVSRTFHTDVDVPNPRVNQFFTMFGQFVDHDISLTPSIRLPTGTNCCNSPFDTDFAKCLNIIIPGGDSFFPSGKCLPFSRSASFCSVNGCTDDNINQLTGFIDSGSVYGSDASTAAAIRANSGGKLLVSPGNILPRIPTGTGPYTAGESRARENPALATMHTIFMREHNRLAALVAARNPALSDEQIYQNTRRIVIAEIQNIVFGEFLPLLIGTEAIFPSYTWYTQYQPTVDPTIFNEFAASAFRFGHTLINGLFKKLDPTSGDLLSSYLIRFTNNNETLYCPDNTTDSSMVSIAKGMTSQAAQLFDNFMTQEVTNFLYATPVDNHLFGQDLASRNIQRGRDNKLPSWVNYRKWCTGVAPTSWSKRPQDISFSKWNILKTLYTSVADIDLFSGSLAENPLGVGVLGTTSTCIVKNQFDNLLKGDRYFFTHSNGGSGFGYYQIQAIKNVKIFDIICLNTNITQLQRRAFEVIGVNNPLISCSNAAGISVSNFV